jgi:SOS-response transcriptional repressor LexA
VDTPKKPLTQRQAAVYAVILHHFWKTGLAPTFRDVMAACGFESQNAVTMYARVLRKKGWLVEDSKLARQLMPVDMAAVIKLFARSLLVEAINDER